MNLTLTYPAWYFLLCIGLGALLSFLLYFRDRRFSDQGEGFTKWIWTMAVLRFLCVSFIAFLLLSPFIRTTSNKTEKPIVVLVQDNSESVKAGMSTGDSSAYIKNIQEVAEKLSKDYEVKTYSFGTNLSDNINWNFNEPATDISKALSEIISQYTNQNLGAIVLASDGIYNKGSNPVYLNYSSVPVFTIGLGDTTVKKDAFISTVYANRVVFLNDYFPLKAEWHADYCDGEKTSVSLFEITGSTEKKLDEKPAIISGNSYHVSTDFILKATEPGLKHYRLRLAEINGEVSTINNIKDIYVEVEEKQEKILILAQAPHPDIAALRQAIEATRNYEVTVSFGNYTGNVNDFSLVILHQLPSTQNNVLPLMQQLHNSKKSVLIISGAQTSVALLNSAQNVFSVQGSNGSTSEATAYLSADFTLFNLAPHVVQALPAFPPLDSPFGEYKPAPGAAILCYQKIGSVATKYPLIFFQQDLNGRTGVIAGEGLWRWRMYDYQKNKNHDAFNALVSSIVQYLSVRADDKQFRVRLEKEQSKSGSRVFAENEPVLFTAELLNESNELINKPDANLAVKEESGKEYPFVFSKSGSGYSLNAGYFPRGNYTWLAKVNYNKKDFTAAGSFTVSPLQLELVSLRADHQLLYALSQKTGGRLFYPSQFNKLVAAIQSRPEIKPVLYATTRTQPLINLRWLFIPIVLLIAAEWAIRKFNGGY